MPTPKQNEEKDEFISRCMGSKKMRSEFPDQKQQAAVCYSYWDKKNESVELTFKTFLKEFDRSDLQLQKQHQDQRSQQQASDEVRDKSSDEYKQAMIKSRGPQKGDVIMSSDGSRKFVVNGISKDGIVVTQLGGDKQQGTLGHDVKFKEHGKTELGKTIYVVAK